MDWDVIVVGAGPMGSYTAKVIAESGFKVLIIEEHQTIGLPVQCAGLISPRTMDLSGVNECHILNHLKGMQIISSHRTCLNITGDSDIALAVDRAAFDQALAEKAENAGAVLMKGTRLEGIERIAGGFRLSASAEKKIMLETRLLIGADGANSRVSKWLGLRSNNTKKAVMYAADAELPSTDPGLISIFLGQNFAPGWFGWLIPLDGQNCRIGTGYALVEPGLSPRQYFQQLINHYPDVFANLKVKRETGGVVPLGLMPRIYTSHAMLVGDAACQVKPISGGGIYLGLRAAQMCAQTAVEALSEDNLSETRMAGYQQLWEDGLKDEIIGAMTLRECYLNFTDEEIDAALRFLSKPYYQALILKHGDIDYPSRLAKFLGIGPMRNLALKAALKLGGNSN